MTTEETTSAASTFRSSLKGRQLKANRSRKVKVNYWDFYNRQLMRVEFAKVKKGHEALAEQPKDLTPKQDPLKLVRTVSNWRGRIERQGEELLDREQGEVKKAKLLGVLRRWHLCESVGDGTRKGKRCKFRFCPFCMAARHNSLRRRVWDLTRGEPGQGTYRLIRLGEWEVEGFGGRQLAAEIKEVHRQAQKVTRNAIKEMGVVGGVVIDNVRSVRVRDSSYKLVLELHLLVVADRKPQAVHLHGWSEGTAPVKAADLGKLLTPVLKVPLGLRRLNFESLMALEQAFNGSHSFGFNGTWYSPAMGSAVGTGERVTKECSPPALELLDAWGAPTAWLNAQRASRLDLEALSTILGPSFPLRFKEWPDDVSDMAPMIFGNGGLGDLGKLCDVVVDDDRRTALVFRGDGMWFALFRQPVNLAVREMVLHLPYKDTQLVMLHLGGPSFINLISSGFRHRGCRKVSNHRGPSGEQ